ncbi:MAG: nucleotidyltransferase domain-containing protein [Gammaproteobacteria bacterium]|nr:nucleotidyltransferase domain-containing protein [Gammaproteobacteria bacterium]
MDQAALIDRVTHVLERVPGLGSAFLGGSHGRDEADAYSDVDIYVVAAEADDIPNLLRRLEDSVDEITPILYSKVLPNARTINCITVDWLRFDLTVVSGIELAFIAGGAVKPLFDRLGLADATAAARSAIEPTTDALLEIANEFIRVLGLSMVVKGREDVVVAQTGTNLLRDMLIRTMAMENAPQPRRGVLALRRDLTPDQVAVLLDLPPLDATWPSIFARTSAIAEQFFPRARALAEKLDAPWPETFDRVTRKLLKDRIGLDV